MEHPAEIDQETLETLRMIHKELELEDAADEEINWEDIKPLPPDPVDIFMERVNIFKDKIYKTFKKSKSVVEDFIPGI